ncbi:hypothetical protein CTI12_AA576430 [Artemisia annua]|uniref:Uncharacterized protein n=1 Tax=Artemisia annua TaxID=35608 RepID=A0A2U1KQE4_ARTAN|nr:hypothetical protein CTI12_AA576430 [Artemisia annua]
MDESQIEVPRGDIDRDGHRLFMVASPDGTCYLVNKQSGIIYWSLKTNRLLRVAFRGDDVNDYLDLPLDDYKIRMYHFQPHRQRPQLIPYDTVELLKCHFDQHYGEKGTEVSIKETCYFIEYGSGVVNGPVDCERGVVESNASWNFFKLKRVEYFLRRSSPMWSLRFSSIQAWFPSSSHEECVRVPCVVYHALNTRSFVKVCKEYNLHPLPSGCSLNELMITNNKRIDPRLEPILEHSSCGLTQVTSS